MSVVSVFTLNKVLGVSPAIENIGNMKVLAHHTVNDEYLALKNKVSKPITKVMSRNANHGGIFKIIDAIEYLVSKFFQRATSILIPERPRDKSL
jgi:hypothetical protein